MISPMPSPPPHSIHAVRVTIVPKPASLRTRLEASVGLVYIVLTLSCAVYYVVLLGPTMSNSLYWPLYNVSGYRTFLVDAINLKLMTKRSGSVDLLSPETASSKAYSGLLVEPAFPANYGRRVLYLELNTLAAAVRDIRATASVRAVSSYAQYCWVDFKTRWDIAHTTARSERCRQTYTDNAAVYLETVLRNTKWDAFLVRNGDTWPIAIADALAATADGQAWLAARPLEALALSPTDEVAHLQSIGLVRFQLNWQNEYQVGLAESVQVQNALGIDQTVQLKTVQRVYSSWTSCLLFWNFFNDLLAMEFTNTSLVRGAPNNVATVLGNDDFYASQLGLQDAAGEYTDQVGVFYATIGQFGSVDSFYVGVPPSLVAFYTSFQAFVSNAMWDVTNSANALVHDLAPVTFTPLPPNFVVPGATYFGGNLVCLFNNPTTFPQAQFAFEDACTTSSPFTVPVTDGKAFLFAWMAATGALPDSICNMQVTAPTASPCARSLRQTIAAMVALGDIPSQVQTNLHDAAMDVPDVHFVQYAQTTNAWLLLQQPLVNQADPNWSFYGWLAIFDWIEGRREVIRLEGDRSTITIMSEAYPPFAVPITINDQSIQNSSQLVFYLTAYVTAVTVAVAVAVFFYTLLHRFHVTGRNLLVFNRVVGSVWIGRPLLLLRGLTAVLTLSTSQTELVQQHGYTRFVFAPRSTLATMVLAGESTWVNYVIDDAMLVIMGRRARYVAPVASFLAWTITTVVASQFPVQLRADLNRECTAVNTDIGLQCTSGVVHVGTWDRVVAQVVVHVACFVVAALLDCVGRRMEQHVAQGHATPLVMHGAAETFYAQGDKAKRMDPASCVLCGLIPLAWRGHPFTFDIKLWIVLRHDDATRTIHSRKGFTSFNAAALYQTHAHDQAKSSWVDRIGGSQWRTGFVTAVGMLYVFLSAAGSISYIAVSRVNLANDFYWATFNLSGLHVATAHWFNEQLPLGRNLSHIRLDQTRWSSFATNYSNPDLQIQSPPLLGPRLQFEALTGLADAVEGLRRTDPCTLPWIFSQYCWVDFHRKWELANSAARQARCLDSGVNGAVYLDTVMRNINDWKTWTQCWGDAFDMAVGAELNTSVAGQLWLKTVHANDNSIDDEVMVWASVGLQTYTVQWQNFKTTGLVNTYAIENAFGVRYPMSLVYTNGSYRLTAQTSYKMYWGLASDLWAVQDNATAIAGRSLIRSSANYAFANTTMLTLLIQNATLDSPLFRAFTLVQSLVGPFGSIDMKNVPCPQSVKRLLQSGLDALRSAIASTDAAASTFVALPVTGNLRAFPTVFLTCVDCLLLSGSVLCQEFGSGSRISQGLFQFTSRVSPCGQIVSSIFIPSKAVVVVATVASGTTSPEAAALACMHEINRDTCLSNHIAPTVSFLQQLSNTTHFAPTAALAAPAKDDVWSLQVSLVQFVTSPSTPELSTVQFALFDPTDPTYDFYSWLFVLEWAMNVREVVRFDGDQGRLAVLTEYVYPTTQNVQANQLPTTFTLYARTGVQYVTAAMLALAVLVLLYIAASRGHIEGANMAMLNRVAGIVWIGRPLLLLRGVTALCLLSTATLELTSVQPPNVAGFYVPPLPWYKTILGASEATWLVYILNDILMVVTKQHTPYYASESSLLVWAVAAVVTLAQPVVHSVSVAPVCDIDQMDFQIVCQSGVVAIGQVARLYTLLAIIALCTLLCYVAARLFVRGLPRESHESQSLLLSSGARYLFNRRRWVHDGIYYIDPASALLNGLVTVKWGKRIFAMDVVLWRHFAVELDTEWPTAQHLHYALPLTD
ncbi:Aste57867_6951 [Aphanomyces stellatus]|uniref:Aste57867_6951 protein n=1 Tax=Aphanomyces stellatus TaxID=120398 RepID=A0A485KHG4_9STRA|nr:hypothetical protein As57867_006929 [Aphanomyces stellatus]VFT83903.1 Aste57867_6951 [Aphanomyces stellatus]